MTVAALRPEVPEAHDPDPAGAPDPPHRPPTRRHDDQPKKDRPEKEQPSGRAARLAAQVDQARGVLDLQDEPALTKAMSRRELRRRQRDARAVRAAKAAAARRKELAATARDSRDNASDDELAAIKATDRVDAARAGAQCRRLTEPGARLAGLYRIQRWLARVLLALVGGGIGWMAVNVHNAAVDGSTTLTDPIWWLSYLIDPLITAPLVVLLVLRGVSARYAAGTQDGRDGRGFGGPRIVVLEAVLLVLSAGLNLSGVAGHELTPAVLMSHVTPPAMVALIVLMYAPITSYLGGLLADAYEEAQAVGRSAHLTSDETRWAQRIGQALAGIHAGQLRLGEDRLPSTNQVERYLRQTGSIAKTDAQRVAEAIREMFPHGITA